MGPSTTTGAIGRITAKGNVKMYNFFSTNSNPTPNGFSPTLSDIISGPDGKLWWQGTVNGATGIARISSSGKLGSVIPVGFIDSNMVRLPNGQVWFESDAGTTGNELGLATRSGIVVTQDLPATSPSISATFSGSWYDLTLGPDGNLWATGGASSIVRISGLDSVSGSLDYRHRPKRAPDYTANNAYDPWTNVTGSAKPTFAGVATPGAEVTLWAQKQGENQPVSIGQVSAGKSDGSWTLTSHVKLSDGNYAVTATQTGDTGPPSVLYSLEPDSSGNLSNALVIQTRHGGK
jgi:streptogramin lyase